MQYNQPYFLFRDYEPMVHHFDVRYHNIEPCMSLYTWDGVTSTKVGSGWGGLPNPIGTPNIPNNLTEFANQLELKYGSNAYVYYNGFYSEIMLSVIIIQKPKNPEESIGIMILTVIIKVFPDEKIECVIDKGVGCCIPKYIQRPSEILNYYIPHQEVWSDDDIKSLIFPEEGIINPKLMKKILKKRTISVEKFQQEHNLTDDFPLANFGQRKSRFILEAKDEVGQVRTKKVIDFDEPKETSQPTPKREGKCVII